MNVFIGIYICGYHPDPNIKHSQHTRRNLCSRLEALLPPYVNDYPNSYLHQFFWPGFEFHINRVTWYVIFSIWFPLLKIMPTRFIHVVKCITSLFFYSSV